MPLLSLASPAQAVLPAAARMLFKPLLSGLLRRSRKSLEESSVQRTMKSVLALNNMARELEMTDPGLAAELRSIALRG